MLQKLPEDILYISLVQRNNKRWGVSFFLFYLFIYVLAPKLFLVPKSSLGLPEFTWLGIRALSLLPQTHMNKRDFSFSITVKVLKQQVLRLSPAMHSTEVIMITPTIFC